MNICTLHTVNLRFSYDFHKKKQSLPTTPSTQWFLYWKYDVPMRYAKNYLNILTRFARFSWSNPIAYFCVVYNSSFLLT